MRGAAFAWFDEGAALDGATVPFWSHGYGVTSVRDLGAAMALTDVSQYNASATSVG